jgi:hypothetical protein
MDRRTLLRWVAAASAAVPFHQVRLWAQPRALTADSIALLHDIGPAVLPASIGPDRIRALVDRFVVWTRGYREGVATAHGYGHPRLQKTGPSPVPAYNLQLAALDAEARARGGRFSALDREQQRAVLDAAFVKAGIRGLPPRPSGQHVVADLMAFYFRSSEANDDCYRAMIQREVCRPIEVTIRRPERKQIG